MNDAIGRMKSVLKTWFPIAVAVTGLTAIIFTVSQQILRQSANDPQIQLSEDIAARIGNGENMANFIPSSKVNIDKSLATYIYIFDKDYKLVGTNALVSDANIEPPKGALEYADKNDRNIITWEPKATVRQAIVVYKFDGKNTGYVVVGRSLRETELRIDTIFWQVFIGWITIMIGSLGVIVIYKFSKK